MTKRSLRLFSKTEPILKDYQHYSIPPEYLDEIYDQLLTPLFGQGLLAKNTILEIGRVNPNSFLFITHCPPPWDSLSSIAAIVGLIPLTFPASQQIRAGQLTGQKLGPEHVAPGAESYSCGYLAMGVAPTPQQRERAAAIIYTSTLLLSFDQVLTLPVTAQGLAVIRRLGFTPVDPKQGKQIGVLQEWRRPVGA